MSRPPRRGAIARCSDGSIGLITSTGPVEIRYRDGTTALAWAGVHLTDKTRQVGDYWSSRTPEVIGYIDELLELFIHQGQPSV